MSESQDDQRDPVGDYHKLMTEQLLEAAEWLGADNVVAVYRPFRRLKQALDRIYHGEVCERKHPFECCDCVKTFAGRVTDDLDSMDELGDEACLTT